jgi:hypothetical protein
VAEDSAVLTQKTVGNWRPAMPDSNVLIEPSRVDEPQAAQDYAEVFSRVASDRRPVIVRREGADFAAVVPLEYLDLLARTEAERLAAQLDWDQLVSRNPPAPEWFAEDEPKPF